MQSSHKPRPAYAVGSLKFQGPPFYSHYSRGFACYNQKHNMIIVCSADNSLQFYDATTFKPIKEREFLKLKDSVFHEISYDLETDTYLLGGDLGFIYKYNASKNELIKMEKRDSSVLRVAFLNPGFYCVLSVSSLVKLSVRSFDDHKDMFEIEMSCYTWSCLRHLPRKNFLFTGSDNGFLKIYRTNRLPRLRALSSCRVFEAGISLTAIENVEINGKEYVVTAGDDCALRIWHFVKGKMSLLKVFRTEEKPCSLVYLEKEKLLAVGYDGSFVNFLRLPSMEIEKQLGVCGGEERQVFWMEDKNVLGVVNVNSNFIQFFRLGN